MASLVGLRALRSRLRHLVDNGLRIRISVALAHHAHEAILDALSLDALYHDLVQDQSPIVHSNHREDKLSVKAVH